MSRSLSGHTAIVTGANHGIGAAIAGRLASLGAHVLVAGYARYGDPDPSFPRAFVSQRRQDSEAVAEYIRLQGGTAEALDQDLTVQEAPTLLFDLAESKLGSVDILVNNASGWRADTFDRQAMDRFGRRLQGVTAASFDGSFAVDARAASLLIAEFARRHIAREATWGRILGLSSGGAAGFPEEVSYGAAKAAQENYTMSAAAELGRYGVTANVVHPPVTDTGWITTEVAEAVAEDPRWFGVAQPEDVANVVAYLCSDDAGRVSGNVIYMR